MAKYVAFLRGINVGKNTRIKMEDLRAVFEAIGFENVKTVIASGNVIFENRTKNVSTLEKKIEDAFSRAFGFNSDSKVLKIESLQKLVIQNPFKDIKLTSHTRLYVTFVKGKSKNKLLFPVKGKGYTMLGIYDGIVCSVIDLSQGRTPDFMRELDKQWKINTTRGWKTIERILNS